MTMKERMGGLVIDHLIIGHYLVIGH